MKKGVFITFEGADGCGKTTQINLLKEFLDKKNIENVVTLEPGSSDLGVELRKILLHYEKPIADSAETFMYLADRAQHVEYVIKPALALNKVVLCDRYTDSTVCYQGYARGGDIRAIEEMNSLATGGLEPDLTIVFDLDAEIAQQRLGNIKDRLEKEGLEFHKKLRTGYLELAKKYKRIKVINSNDTIENINKKVVEAVLECLEKN